MTIEYDQDKEDEKKIEIPVDKLSTDALENLVTEFILREGTDYGQDEVSHEQKIAQIYSQIRDQKIKVVYSSKTQDCTLLRAE